MKILKWVYKTLLLAGVCAICIISFVLAVIAYMANTAIYKLSGHNLFDLREELAVSE
jgi:hypothetical protein